MQEKKSIIAVTVNTQVLVLGFYLSDTSNYYLNSSGMTGAITHNRMGFQRVSSITGHLKYNDQFFASCLRSVALTNKEDLYSTLFVVLYDQQDLNKNKAILNQLEKIRPYKEAHDSLILVGLMEDSEKLLLTEHAAPELDDEILKKFDTVITVPYENVSNRIQNILHNLRISFIREHKLHKTTSAFAEAQKEFFKSVLGLPQTAHRYSINTVFPGSKTQIFSKRLREGRHTLGA